MADGLAVPLSLKETLFADLFKPLEEIYGEMYETRQFDAVYFLMMVLSCLIALSGLLINSPAVIIGAMLISPLMGPILCCGLAFTLADGALAKKAARNVILSVVETVVITALAAWLSPLKDATPEILARTNPNLMDLFIALFSGVAGVLAMCSRKGGMTIIPGVAIATAVMPPLATVGYGISTGQWHIAGGAMMLFVTNLAAIILSADLIFLWVGFRPVQEHGRERARRFVKARVWISLGTLIVISIPLVRTLSFAVQQSRTQHAVQAMLESRFGGKSAVSWLEIRETKNQVLVDATVRSMKAVEQSEVDDMQKSLSKNLERDVRLNLQEVALKRPGVKPAVERDYVGGAAVKPVVPQRPVPVAEAMSKLQGRVQSVLASAAASLGVERMRVVSMGGVENGTMLISVAARQTAVSDPSAWNVVAWAVSQEFGAPVTVMGTTIAPMDTEALQYRAKSERLAWRMFVKLRDTAKKAPQEWQVVVTPAADAEADVTAKRVKWLEKNLKRTVVLDASLDDQLKADEMRVSWKIPIRGISDGAPQEEAAAPTTGP